MRNITNSDYTTDEAGVLHLKPAVQAELHAGFIEALIEACKARKWDLSINHGETPLEWSPAPIITLPTHNGSIAYSVNGGPIQTRTRLDAIASDYTDISYQIRKVRYEGTNLVEDDSKPGVRVETRYVGVPGDYEAAIWAREVTFMLEGIHHIINP